MFVRKMRLLKHHLKRVPVLGALPYSYICYQKRVCALMIVYLYTSLSRCVTSYASTLLYLYITQLTLCGAVVHICSVAKKMIQNGGFAPAVIYYLLYYYRSGWADCWGKAQNSKMVKIKKFFFLLHGRIWGFRGRRSRIWHRQGPQVYLVPRVARVDDTFRSFFINQISFDKNSLLGNFLGWWSRKWYR